MKYNYTQSVIFTTHIDSFLRRSRELTNELVVILEMKQTTIFPGEIPVPSQLQRNKGFLEARKAFAVPI